MSNITIQQIAEHFLDHIEPMYRGTMKVQYPYSAGACVALGVDWSIISATIDQVRNDRESATKKLRKEKARFEQLERQRINIERKRGANNP